MRKLKLRGGADHIGYSPSGHLIVARNARHAVQVWDAHTFEPSESIPAGDPREKLIDCLFRPGGLTFLRAQGYCSDGQDFPVGEPRREHRDILPGTCPRVRLPNQFAFAGGGFYSANGGHWACFGADGGSFVGWHRGAAVPLDGLWTFDGVCLRPLAFLATGAFHEIALSPDGRFLACGDFGGPHTATVADLRTDPPSLSTLYYTNDVTHFAWSPVAPLLAVCASRSVWLTDATTGQPGRKLAAFGKNVEALTFSQDGRLLMVGSRVGRVCVWEVASGRQIADFDWEAGKVNDVAFSPDGSTAAAACSKGVVVWDVG
jgi:WD40 repeat protein